jgi:asparaginyl-tRNA synthetase
MRIGSNLRTEKDRAVLRIRAKVLSASREWFDQHGYVEVHGPTIIPVVGDCSSFFEIKYFNSKAFLTQGLQPYAHYFVSSLEKIYTIAPTFRAEKVNTRRHLTEYWRIEVAQQCDLDRLIGFEEALVEHVCQSLSKQTPEMLSCFQRSAEDFAKVKAPFPKLTYDEAVDLLQSDGFDVNWGQKLSWKMEKHLSLRFTIPFFITTFPLSIETFFNKSDPKRPELTLSADLIAPEGYGEIGSSVQRITDKNVLSQKMTEENIDREDQKWYLNFMPNDSLPHSGFAIGVERLIQWICKLAHIKEAIAFPRLPDHVYP